jgi:hypothetical protein
MYLLDAKSMRLQQEPITASTNQYDPAKRDDTWDKGPHLHGSPTYWRGPDPTFGGLYVWGEKDFLRLYRFNTITGRLETSAHRQGAVEALRPTTTQTPMPGGMISISSDGNTSGTGIVWATLPVTYNATFSDIIAATTYEGQLFAFDAENLNLLWTSNEHFYLGHWAVPTIADGKVFVGTASGLLYCYELGPDSGPGRISRTPSQPQETPFQPQELPAGRPMTGHWDESVMTLLPTQTIFALAPPAQAVKYAVVFGEGDAAFAAKAAATGRKLSWMSQGTSLQGVLTLASNVVPEQNKVELKVSPSLVWTASDGSIAETRRLKSYNSPVDGNAEWELYEVTRSTGRGVLEGIRFVQRVLTTGGLPPTSAPTTSADTVRVPFQAQYILYR